jgi:hypothetical protein
MAMMFDRWLVSYALRVLVCWRFYQLSMNFGGNSPQLNKKQSGNGDKRATREPDLQQRRRN